MKKILSIIIVGLLGLSLLTGCGKSNTPDVPETIEPTTAEIVEADVLPVHVEGAIFGGANDDSIALGLKFNPDWLTNGDNKKYNKDLAAFSSIISADVYFRQKDLEKAKQNRVLVDGADSDAYDWTVLLKTLGFTDVEYIESYKAKPTEVDSNDSTTLTLGYVKENNCDCFVVSIRGAFSSAEWDSIFDVGCESEKYTELTGEHPEWKDTNVYKGADIAYERTLEFVKDFIAEHDDASCDNCILVTGHSRGGVIAELLGAKLEDEGNSKCFTYTFNSIPITKDEKAKDYQTIFNINDSNDFFEKVISFKNEKFYRYGKELSLSISASDEMKNEISKLKGRDDYAGLDDALLEKYVSLFEEEFEDRESLYVPLTSEKSFDSEEEAKENYETLKGYIDAETGLGLNFCSLTDVTAKDGKYSFEINYCKGTLLQSIGKILAYGGAAKDAVKSLFANDENICSIADFIMDNAAAINGGHLLVNSYVLTGYIK